MKMSEYEQLLQQHMETFINSPDQGKRKAAEHAITKLEKRYKSIIPVEHQPITFKQHKANYYQYNKTIRSNRSLTIGISCGTMVALLAIVIIVISGKLSPYEDTWSFICCGMVGLACLVATIAIEMISWTKYLFWARENPIDSYDIWTIADYE